MGDRVGATGQGKTGQGNKVGGVLRQRWRRSRSAATDALVRAFAEPAVRRGMVGAALIAVGSITPAFLPENSPWWELLGAVQHFWLAKLLGTLAALAGVALIMQAWMALRPRPAAPVVGFRAVLVLWSFPMLLAPPVFSHDAYAYAAEGEMISEGINPYQQPVAMMPGRWADQVVETWRFTRAPYGPLALQLNHLVVNLFGHSPYWSASVGMRLLAILGVVAVAATVPPLARRLGIDPREALWFGIVNPLTITHLIGGLHNDAIMIGLVALALFVASRGRFLVGCALVAAAAAVKIPAILAIVPVALLAWPVLAPAGTRWRRFWQGVWRVALGTITTVLMFVFITLACGLGWGWIKALNVPGMVFTMAPSTMLGDALRQALYLLGFGEAALGITRIVRMIGIGVGATVIAFQYIRYTPQRPMTFLPHASLALVLGSPALHPWYFTWIWVFLAFARPSLPVTRITAWASILLLAYSSINFAIRNEAFALAGSALLAFGWLLWGQDREQFRRSGPRASTPSDA